MLHAVIVGIAVLGMVFSFYLSPRLSIHSDSASAIHGLSLPSVGPGRLAEAVLTSSVLPATVKQEQLARDLATLSGQPTVAAGGAAGAPVAATTPGPLYQLYAVAAGDTASAIASRYGVQLQYLLDANPDVNDGQLLTVGQMLIVPTANGVLHHVRYGETLSDVAVAYRVSVNDILNYPGNAISSADQVSENQLVFVPNGTVPVAAAPAPTAASPVVVSAPPSSAPPVSASQSGPVSGHGLIWPVTGPISSYMGPSHPLGIDIDLYATPYTPIHAATSGTVTFAGGDPCCSYGYHVIIMSPQGIETVYAHFSSIAVSEGQVVSQGDELGISGCTGYCTGNHLHFEVIDNGVRVNPLDYLP